MIDGATLSQKNPQWIAQWPGTIPTYSTNPTIDNAEPTSYGGWSRPASGAQGWSFWQYAGDPAGGPTGTCPGVGNGTTTPCDNDAFNGDEEALQDYVIGPAHKWDLNTWVSPSITVTAFSTSTGTTGTNVAAGTAGKIISAPVYANSYVRYQVQFNNGVTGWVVAPNMNTLTPGVVSNPTPANGSTPNPIPSTWTWNAATNASGYKIYIDGTLRGTTTTNSWTFSASLGTGNHTWRVDATNDSVTTTGPNWTFNFTSIGGTPSNPSPADGSVTTNTSITYTWDPVPNATSYDFYFGTSQTPFANVTTTSFGPITRSSGLQQWHVVAKNSATTSIGPNWTFRIDTQPPTAAFVQGDATPTRGSRTFDFRISYADLTTDVDRSSFGDGDVIVTGPNGYSQPATFVSNSFNTATYRVVAPGGLWDANDNGTYTVSQVAGHVKDVAGNTRPAGAITNGTFDVTGFTGFAYVLGTTLHVESAGAVALSANGVNASVDEGPGKNASFPLASFSDVIIHGTEIDDGIAVASTLGKPLAVDGGGGNDSLALDSGVQQTFDTDAALTVAGFATSLDLTIHGGALATFNATQHFAALHVDGAAVLTAGGGRDIAIVTRALSVNGGSLDLGDHALVYDYAAGDPSPLGDATGGGGYSGVNGMILSARNGGTWNGTGLSSSIAAASQGRTGLLAAEASSALNLGAGQTGLFAGQTVDATSVLVKYTWAGDANLSGVVDGDDYFLVDLHAASNFDNPPPTVYGAYTGDFDLNGFVDGDDYFLIDSVMGRQDGPIV
jgi:hypothetical protein